jgi:hypothetical protein
VVGVGEVEAAAEEAVESVLRDEGLQVGEILIPNSALTVLSVTTPRSPHRHERGVSDRLGHTNQVDATAYRWLSIMRGGHSSVTQFRNQEDSGGLERTRRARRLDTLGTAGIRLDLPSYPPWRTLSFKTPAGGPP